MPPYTFFRSCGICKKERQEYKNLFCCAKFAGLFFMVRMCLNGCKFANIPDTIIHARINRDMYRRRGGYSYFRSFLELERFKYRNRIIGFDTYIANITQRFFVHVFVPTSLRDWIFKRLCREKVKK